MMLTHVGGCHCGRVRFEFTAPAKVEVFDCDCSVCSKAGYLHILVPDERFKLLDGQDSLTLYTFNTGAAKHLFCSVCGIKSFYKPRTNPNGISVNARCVDAGTIESMSITPFNGRDWDQGRAALGKADLGGTTT